MSLNVDGSNIQTKPLIDVIIPTFDNPKQVTDCVVGFLENTHPLIQRILIVNNGQPGALHHLHFPNKDVYVKDMGSNLGWQGGINSVLPDLEAPFTMLLNDDTFVPTNDPIWLLKLTNHFRDPKVGAVGPSSNFVMQKQNMFLHQLPRMMETTLLIGFCLMVRTELLKKLNGLEESIPGGDDLDLSIRIRKEGYRLIIDRNVFVYHHGQQTGKRVYGQYWDSAEHQDKTNMELIRRHGLREYLKTRASQIKEIVSDRFNGMKMDSEGDLIRDGIKNGIKKGVVVELGCGNTKTIPDAIGVDIFPKGQEIPTLKSSRQPSVSVADVVAYVDALPFENEYADVIISRHILEHMIDSVKTLKEWERVLKKDGEIWIAVPNNEICSGIPLNPEHVHAFTPSSLTSLIEASTNLRLKENIDPKNGISFIGVFKK